MKLKLSQTAFADIIQAEMLGSNDPTCIQEVAYDTRKIVRTDGVVFFGLKRRQAKWFGICRKRLQPRR